MPSAAQVQAAESGRATHPQEPHSGGTAGRLNWLRAAVLGANDGIVSVAGIVIGVAGATTNRGPIFTAGLAGLVAGAVSMALGEYVSVSSQRDSERAQIKQEQRELAASPEAELTELTALYEAKGLSAATAHTVAVELSARGALAAHLDAELHIDPADIPSPVQAAVHRHCRSLPAPCCRCWPSCCPRPACGSRCFRRRPDRSGPDRCPQRSPGRQRRPPRRPAGCHRRSARPGLHLRRRASLRHRHRLRTRNPAGGVALPGNRAERSHPGERTARGSSSTRGRAPNASALLASLAGAGDGADGRGQRQPQPDRHDHGREVAEGPDTDVGPAIPAKIISSHALTKKAGPAATILK